MRLNPTNRTSGSPDRSSHYAWRTTSTVLTVLGLWLLSGWSLLAAPGLTMSLDRNVISMGESAVLSLAFTDANPGDPPPLRPPNGSSLTVGYLGQSSQISVVNGAVNSTVIYRYQLSPSQPGDFTIPGITVPVNGQQLTGQAVKLKVLKPHEQPPAAESAPKSAFLKLSVPKKEYYVGETFAVDVQLFVQRIQNASPPVLESSGFTFGKTLNTQNPFRTQVGNSVYTVYNFKIPVTALRPGPLPLGPAHSDAILLIPRADIPDFFGMQYEGRQVTLSSEIETVNVIPLPQANVPTNFNGAVGSYNLSVTAGPTNVVVGDPITLKIQISGQGPIESLTLPALSDWRDFKAYTPSTQVNPTDPLGLQGSKSFEQVVAPENPDVKMLPPVVFSFFDPVKKQYRTLSSAAIPLTVRATTNAPAQPTVIATTQPPTGPAPRDIVHIKTYPGTLGTIQPPLARQSWFLALQIIPLLTWIGMVIWRQQSDRLANNPRLRRRREVERLVQTGLLELRTLANANKGEDFFAAAFRLLQEQLGERLNLPASAITESVIEERLKPAGVSAEILGQLHTLFQTCNYARYAKHRTTHELNALLAQIEAVLNALKDLPLDKS